MALKISQEIIDQTTECDKDFSCLVNNSEPSCKISACIKNAHFIEKLDRLCPYYIEYGHQYLCTCPVRKEIHRKYGI